VTKDVQRVARTNKGSIGQAIFPDGHRNTPQRKPTQRLSNHIALREPNVYFLSDPDLISFPKSCTKDSKKTIDNRYFFAADR